MTTVSGRVYLYESMIWIGYAMSTKPTDADKIEIGKRIKSLRTRIRNSRGGVMSAQELIEVTRDQVEEAGLPKLQLSSWQNWESGLRVPNRTLTPLLAKILNTNPLYIYLWTNDPSPEFTPIELPQFPSSSTTAAFAANKHILKQLDIGVDEFEVIEASSQIHYGIDTQDTHYKHDGTFAIKVGDQYLIRYISKKLNGQFELTDPNKKDSESELVSEEELNGFDIVGRCRAQLTLME